MSPWLTVWTRAVVGPAARRAAGLWVGAGILAAVIFGPTGMQPRDLTGLALHAPLVGCALAATWLLVYLPIARGIVRADGARYLAALPGPRFAPMIVGAAALIALQLPWVVLWLAGDGVRGAAIVGGLTCVIAVLARWRPPVRVPRAPRWTSSLSALRGVHGRALRRRAGDALMRGTGLALLAGATAGLFVRNNELTGESAAVLGASVLAVVLVPAQVGVLLVLAESHRQAAWLAASLGVGRGTSIAALALTVSMVNIAATAIGLVAAVLVCRPDPTTLAVLAMTSLVVAVGCALATTRPLLREVPATSRTVSGAVVAASATVLALGTLGVWGAPVILALCALALTTVRA